MEGFQAELMARMSLGQAVLKLFDYVLDSAFLRSTFDANRGRCYERELGFDRLVYLIRDALVIDHGSGRQSFERAEAEGGLAVTVQSAYGKLGRVPLEVSTALLSGGAVRLGELLPATGGGVTVPESLRAMKPTVIDGKKIKNAAKRLKALRGLPGKMLGGKLLVALSLETGLAIAMNADQDGERNDVPLVPGLVGQVRALGPAARLWIADRQFADLKMWALLTEGRDHFLIRCPRNLGFVPDPSRPAREGTDLQGRRYVEEWGQAGSQTHPQRRYVRRITLFRPGEDDVILATDLLDGQAYPATDLLAAYLQRWGIERMFQQVTEVLELRRLIGSTPKAMIFQAALCFLLYNQIQVIKAYVAADGGKQPEQVSGELLFRDVRVELQTWARFGDPSLALKLLPPIDQPDPLRHWLAERLRGAWTDRWLKAPANKRRPSKHAPVPQGQGGHSSVWRLIQAARQAAPRRP